MTARQIEPNIFDLLDDYASELRADRVPLRKTVAATSKLLAFIEGFFSQLYHVLFDVRITALDADSKYNSVVLRHQNRPPKQVRRLMALFEEICDTREDLIGASYGGGSTDVFKKFHRRTVPRLLRATTEWAESANEPALVQRCGSTLRSWEEGMAAVSW
jgi:hypothetical protein